MIVLDKDLRNTEQENDANAHLRFARQLYPRKIDQWRSHVDYVRNDITDTLGV